MEPEGNAPGVQPQSWREFFPQLAFQPHSGQRDSYQAAASDDAGDVLLVLPTGYGKTRTGLGWYLIRRERGLVDRCLWVVSSDEQRLQLSPLADKKTGLRPPAISDHAGDWFGLPCAETVTADATKATVRMHQRGLAEVFVTTYQSLRENYAFYQELLATGSWLVIGDEAHHLSITGAWAAWLESRLQPRVETVYMSATPLRTDGVPLKNVPSRNDENGNRTYHARVERTWTEAMTERAIRTPRAHEEEWQLEFRNAHGDLVRLTTTQLRDLNMDGQDFDAWVIQNGLRYTMTYLEGIIRDAVAVLNEKRARWPGQHQMIVFALGCNHAKFLAEQVFNQLGILGAEADWIGVTRSDAENRAIIQKFKEGRLTVLIQVDKAGEGFDHPPCSVGLFLNSVSSRTKLLQELGRLLRRIFNIPPEEDIADVFASSDHPIIEVVREMRPSTDAYHEPGAPNGTGGSSGWPSLPALAEIMASWVKTNTIWPNDTSAFGFPPDVIRVAEQFGMPPGQVQEIVRMVNGVAPQPVTAPNSEVGRQAQVKDRVSRAMSLVASSALKLHGQQGGIPDPKRVSGLIMKNINTRWKAQTQGMGHDQMLSEDFERKYEWLREIQRQMGETRQVPSWLTRDW